MVRVNGSWRMIVLYGSISVLLLCIFQFGWFGIVTKGHTEQSPAELARQRHAAEEGRTIDRFNACLKAAETNLKKVHACQRQRYGSVPKQ
jgi:Tfp pilus assembly protein PilN